MRVPITIPEDDQPLLTFAAKVRNGDGTLSVMDLSGGTIAWVSKVTDATADASGQTIVGTVVGSPVDGVFTVQITAAVTAEPGIYFYKVVVTKSAKPLTIQYGPLIIDST
jgi:hypothetical protein